MMIDAGLQGNRLHLYEFEKRILRSTKEVCQPVKGLKSTFPTTSSFWTNRLYPGISAIVFHFT